MRHSIMLACIVVQTMRILIADDNEGVRRALHQMIMAHEGWTVCGDATDGFDAVQQAKNCEPDIVLLDFAMPALNGLGAAARISQLLPGVPIIMYTLYDSPQFEVEAKKCGVWHVVSKSDNRLMIAALETLAQSIPANDNNHRALPPL